MRQDLESLTYERRGRTGIITFTRPEQRNALDLVMRAELARIVAVVRADRDLSAVVLTGTDGTFCAGGDLKSLTESKRTVAENHERIAQLHGWFDALVNLDLPVIAAVDGPAYGAGMNLALAADLVLASERARFCAVFGRIGLVPDLGGFFLLPRIVGMARAKELVLTGRSIDAHEARDMGIVLSVHSPDTVLETALELAARFDNASRLATGLSKTILNQALHSDQRSLADKEAMAQALCLETEYHQSAVARFLNKQPLAFDWDRMANEERV